MSRVAHRSWRPPRHGMRGHQPRDAGTDDGLAGESRPWVLCVMRTISFHGSAAARNGGQSVRSPTMSEHVPGFPGFALPLCPCEQAHDQPGSGQLLLVRSGSQLEVRGDFCVGPDC